MAIASVTVIDPSDGRELFVSDGISAGKAFMTVYRKPSGAIKRFVSKWLPIRGSRAEAEADLLAWAQKHGAKPAQR